MFIVLVRHGQTDYNKKGIMQGQQVDPLLNKLGRLQAKYTGRYLQKYFKFEKVYSSPLLRAKQTAQIIVNELNYDKKIIYHILYHNYYNLFVKKK